MESNLVECLVNGVGDHETEADEIMQVDQIVKCVKCINRKCSRKNATFTQASSNCREFFILDRAREDPAPSTAFVCMDCHQFYQNTMESFENALKSGTAFDLKELPIFAANHEKEHITLNLEDEVNVNEGWIRDPIIVDIEDGESDITIDAEGSGLRNVDFGPMAEEVGSGLTHSLQEFLHELNRETERLKLEESEILKVEASHKEALARLKAEKEAFEEENPRRLLLIVPEIDCDEPGRPIPTGDLAGTGPPIWATHENVERMTKAGRRHLLDGHLPTIRKPVPVTVPVLPSARVFGIQNPAPVQEQAQAQVHLPRPPGRPMDPSESEEIIPLEVLPSSCTLPDVGQQNFYDFSVSDQVYVPIHGSINPIGFWHLGTVIGVPSSSQDEKSYRVQIDLEHTIPSIVTVVKRHMAYPDPAQFRIAFSTRVIAKNSASEPFYPGTITEPPSSTNRGRYLVFFDNDKFKYCEHADLRLIADQPRDRVWEHCPAGIANTIKRYLEEWPERPLLKLSKGCVHEVYSDRNWKKATVVEVDAALALFKFPDKPNCEWIYRGSHRLKMIYDDLMVKKRRTAIPMRSTRGVTGPIIQYTNFNVSERNDREQRGLATASSPVLVSVDAAVSRVKNQTARKTTGGAARTDAEDAVIQYSCSEGEGEIQKVAVNPIVPQKPFKPHTCNHKCWRDTAAAGVEIYGALKEFLTKERPSPFLIPLKLGFTRHLMVESKQRYRKNMVAQKANQKNFMVFYTGPCGRKLPSPGDVYRYLKRLELHHLAIDQFLFSPTRSVTYEFKAKSGLFWQDDLTKGLEKVPISCVNVFDSMKPEVVEKEDYFAYRVTGPGVDINKDPDFLVCCECEDDCADPRLCRCQKLTEEQATDPENPDESKDVLYKFRRLESRVDTGIYECNQACKCNKQTCFNRVAQNPISVKLQLFKTEKKRWGVRALTDLPKGCFVATYAGHIFTNEAGHEDGQLYGDDYLAELDFIQINEKEKEGYEAEVENSDDEDDEVTVEEENDDDDANDPVYNDDEEEDDEDGDDDAAGHSRGRRTRRRRNGVEDPSYRAWNVGRPASEDGDGQGNRPQLRTRNVEPRASSGIHRRSAGNKAIEKSKYIPLLSHFKEKNPYVMDAKRGGNIGKYFNHSCEPNMFVQNVFVDTHDPRFHWVALFTSRDIKAGEELAWDYGYQVGSVPGKKIICHCGSSNCRGRLL